MRPPAAANASLTTSGRRSKQRKASYGLYVSKSHAGLAKEIGDWAEGECNHGPYVACTSEHLLTAIRFVIVDARLRARLAAQAQTDLPSIEGELRRIRTALSRTRTIKAKAADVHKGADRITEEVDEQYHEISDALDSIEARCAAATECSKAREGMVMAKYIVSDVLLRSILAGYHCPECNRQPELLKLMSQGFQLLGDQFEVVFRVQCACGRRGNLKLILPYLLWGSLKMWDYVAATYSKESRIPPRQISVGNPETFRDLVKRYWERLAREPARDAEPVDGDRSGTAGCARRRVVEFPKALRGRSGGGK